MVRMFSLILGIGLVILGFYGFQQPISPLVPWLDIAAAVAAFIVAATADRRKMRKGERRPPAEIGAPFAIGVSLLVVWFVAFAANAPNWLVWWNFAFACAFCIGSMIASYAPEHDYIRRPHYSRNYYTGYPWDPFATGAMYPGSWYGWPQLTAVDDTRRGKGPKGYRRTDARILEDVSDRLWEQWDIDASDIELQVSQGEVTMEGSVENRRSKKLAEHMIEAVPGVAEIHNRLRVKKAGTSHVRAAS